jgi:hypothetical protein
MAGIAGMADHRALSFRDETVQELVQNQTMRSWHGASDDDSESTN